MTSPQDPLILVTGASSGIGRAVALRLAGRGNRVVLLSRTEEHLEAVAAECLDAGATLAQVEPLDVGDDADVERVVGRLHAEHGSIDVLVNVAGVAAYGDVDEVPVDVFDTVVRTNLLGLANLARHIIPLMREQGQGTIVQVGSLLGHISVPHMTPYVVSKWGARALVRQLRLENRDHSGLDICDLIPGGVDTDIYASAANYSDRVGEAPFPVSPETVAKAVVGLIDHPRRERQVGLLNRVMTLVHTLVPRTFDAVVGPLFDRAASSDSTDGKQSKAGNVV